MLVKVIIPKLRLGLLKLNCFKMLEMFGRPFKKGSAGQLWPAGFTLSLLWPRLGHAWCRPTKLKNENDKALCLTPLAEHKAS